jgi:hypothetical protein
MKRYKSLQEEQDDIKVGDTLLTGKWKNKKVVVAGFGTDKNNQPTVLTDKGEIPLYKFRIQKLMVEK